MEDSISTFSVESVTSADSDNHPKDHSFPGGRLTFYPQSYLLHRNVPKKYSPTQKGLKMSEMKAWYWLVFAMILIMSELMIPNFTIIWFGLGAFLVAGILWFIPQLPLSLQLFFWAVASILFTILWFKVFKGRMEDHTKAGLSLEAVLGESGLVIKPSSPDKRGVVKFTTPVLGSEQWAFICHEDARTGDRVRVVDVSGNTLIVQIVNTP